jgi:hypothetical protein
MEELTEEIESGAIWTMRTIQPYDRKNVPRHKQKSEQTSRPVKFEGTSDFEEERLGLASLTSHRIALSLGLQELNSLPLSIK